MLDNYLQFLFYIFLSGLQDSRLPLGFFILPSSILIFPPIAYTFLLNPISSFYLNLTAHTILSPFFLFPFVLL